MEKRLIELAAIAGCEISGDKNQVIRGVAPLDSASEGEITFLLSSKYLEKLDHSKASAVIVHPDMKVEGKNLLISKNPQLTYAKILTLFNSRPFSARGVDKRAFIGRNPRLGEKITISPFSCIGDNVVIGERVSICPGVFVGNDCKIGDDVILYPNSVLMDGTVLGNRVIIHPGAVIGSDGFGYARDGKSHFKIPQVGTVELEDDVEVGANTTIDRAAFGKTLVRRGTKIDNLAQVAHNVKVGEDCIIVAQVGIAGSTTLGNNVILGGQSAVSDHVSIGDNVMAGGRSGIASDVPENQVVSGAPAINHREWLKASMIFAKLPEMKKTIRDLEKRIEELEAKSRT